MELTSTDVRAWLAEDVGAGDATTNAVIDEGATCDARVLLKEPGVVCGLDVAAARLPRARSDSSSRSLPTATASSPAAIAHVSGPARAVLTGERTGSQPARPPLGIATLARCYVDAVDGTGAVDPGHP